jgi:transcriptional regulator with XRE-family HTH domain
MTQDSWPARFTRQVIAEMKRQREDRGWSAQRLADECSQLGLPMSRSTIADLENGRRAHLGIPEVAVLGRALGIPPLLLLYRVGTEGEAEVMPGETRSPFRGAEWFCGSAPYPGPDDDAYIASIREDWLAAAESPLALYRAYDRICAEEVQALGRARGMDERAAQDPASPDLALYVETAAALRQIAADHAARAENLRRRAEEMGYLPPG